MTSSLTTWEGATPAATALEEGPFRQSISRLRKHRIRTTFLVKLKLPPVTYAVLLNPNAVRSFILLFTNRRGQLGATGRDPREHPADASGERVVLSPLGPLKDVLGKGGGGAIAGSEGGATARREGAECCRRCADRGRFVC